MPVLHLYSTLLQAFEWAGRFKQVKPCCRYLIHCNAFRIAISAQGDGSAVKSTCGFSRVPGFGSLYPCGDSVSNL